MNCLLPQYATINVVNKTVGTLLPLTALHTHNEDLFEAALPFIDWLAASKQNVWQILPIHKTIMHKSPLFYSPYSSYGVGINPSYTTIENPDELPSPSTEFLNVHGDWVEDYAVFVEIARQQDTDKWPDWPQELRSYDTQGINNFKKKYLTNIDRIIRIQANLHTKWNRVLAYARDKGVQIWGDMPYYVPVNSPTIWSNQDLFELNEDGSFTFASGVEAGKQHPRQLWEHPLYRWSEKRNNVTNLFKERIKYCSYIFNRTRWDSIINYYSYGRIHMTDEAQDTRANAPGNPLFRELIDYTKQIGTDIYAEDISGHSLKDARKIMDDKDVPGISVFTQGMTLKDKDFDHTYFNPLKFKDNHIYFTSNHDSLPLVSYLKQTTEFQNEMIRSQFNLSEGLSTIEFATEVRDYIVDHAQISIIQMQDWLLSENRINIPGTVSPKNWSFQLPVHPSELPTDDLILE